jgi:hypothetical protein
MTDLKERAIRAAVERGQSSREQEAALEAVRLATIEDWLLRRVYRLMRRVLDTHMDLDAVTVSEQPVEGIADWTRATLTGTANGLRFGTTAVFNRDGRDIPVGDSDLLVWIPCEACGAAGGPFHVGSLSALGDLLRLWERCGLCQALDHDLDSSCGAEDAPEFYLPGVPSSPRVTVDRERQDARRRQGGGREALA